VGGFYRDSLLSDILQEEVKIRQSLAAPKLIAMALEDWEKFKSATDCHICNKSLIKDEFLDSLPVGSIEEDSEGGENAAIKAKGTKNVFTEHRKNENGGFLG